MRTWIALSLSVLAVSACGATDGRSGPEAAGGCRARAAAAPGGATPVLGIHHVPSLTRERYEAVVRQLTNGHERLESLSDGNIEGLVLHVAGEGDDGFWVVDVWASQEAVDRFAQRVRPIAQAVGIQQPMKTYAIHTLLTC